MKSRLLVVLVLFFAIASPAFADQAVVTNSGGSTSGVGGLSVSTSGVVPAGTLNLSCPGASALGCTGGSVVYLSSDGSTSISGAFTSGSLVESCSGGGRGGHVTCGYSFTGYFSGTATINGVAQAINGVTYQSFGSTGAGATGLTAWNSAYSPFYYSDTEQVLRSDDIKGTNQITFGSQGSGVGQFYGAYGIAVDSVGRIYVADTYNCRITRMDDMNGTNWTTYGGTCGSGPGSFSNPVAIAVDSLGRIYVADTGNSQIVRVDDMTGTNYVAYGTSGTGVGQFSYPQSLALDATGRIYIADASNPRVVRIDDMNGTNWVALTQSPVVNGVSYTLQSPAGVAVDAAGEIYIAQNSSPQVQVVRVDDMMGTNWTSLSTGTGSVNSISVDTGGTVFVGQSGVKLIDSMKATLGSSGTIGPYGTAYVYAVTALQLPIPHPPAMTLSASSLAFANQNIGTTGTAQVVTIANFGGSPLSFSSITATGGFVSSSNCPSALASGSSCTVSVSFAPSLTGSANGTLTISDNSGNMGVAQVVSLSGTGTAPAAQVSPTSVSFPAQLVSTTSGAAGVVVLNSGTGPLTVSSVVATAPFAQTNNCSAQIAPGAGCTIMVTFTPTASGPATGALTVTDDTGVQQVSLSGTGTTSASKVTISATSLLFPEEAVNTTSGAQTVTITNTGTTTVAIAGVTITGNFSKTTTCTTSLKAGKNCTVSVSFRPTTTGSLSGTVTIAMASGTLTVALAGTGVSGSVPSALVLTPQAVSFNNNYVVGDNPSQTITVTNTSNANVGINSVVLAGDPSYRQRSKCGTLLAAGSSCTISITFTPTTYGTFTGTLTLTEGSGTADVVTISGIAYLNGG